MKFRFCQRKIRFILLFRFFRQYVLRKNQTVAWRLHLLDDEDYDNETHLYNEIYENCLSARQSKRHTISVAHHCWAVNACGLRSVHSNVLHHFFRRNFRKTRKTQFNSGRTHARHTHLHKYFYFTWLYGIVEISALEFGESIECKKGPSHSVIHQKKKPNSLTIDTWQTTRPKENSRNDNTLRPTELQAVCIEMF